MVVLNFLNTENAADERVYKILDEKFKLFEGVFGASDEILGSIGSGVDFENRIALKSIGLAGQQVPSKHSLIYCKRIAGRDQ